MDKPNYVLKANERMLVPDEKKSMARKIKVAIWILVGAIILGSIIFQDNLFGELNWSSRLLLIALVLNFGFKNTDKRVSSPFEIQFYNDYLIVYRERRYCSKNVITKEYDTFFYKDIQKCKFRTITKQIIIQGAEEAIRYKYNKDGSLPKNPTYQKTTEGLCYFYTTEEPNIDFVLEIEKHSPIKVAIVE